MDPLSIKETVNVWNVPKVLKFPIPKFKNEQILISEKIETCEGKICEEKSIRNKLQQMKQGLMHDLLTGQVQVTIDKAGTAQV